MKSEKSKKILEAMEQNIEAFRGLLQIAQDELTKQNILRSIILFSCSGIDAIVKQLIIETLENVIERDEGAQEQLRKFVTRKLKKNNEVDYTLFASLLTARDSRKNLINLLKQELTFDSLQSSEQLYKVAGYFNIATDSIVDNQKKKILSEAFATRNRIVHQMDVDFDNKQNVEIISHNEDDVENYYDTIRSVARNYICEVDKILERDVTEEYTPLFSLEGDVLTINGF